MSTNVVQKATGASPSGLTDSLIFDDGTSVGIGTTSPSLGQLHIKNTAGHSQLALQSADNAQAELRIRKVTGDAGWSIYKPASSLDLRFWDGVDRVTFQSGGNVGIGTTTPDARLHVSSGNGGKIKFDGGQLLRFEMPSNDCGIILGDPNVQNDPRIDFYSGDGGDTNYGTNTGAFDNRIVSLGTAFDGPGQGVLRFRSKVLEIMNDSGSSTPRALRFFGGTNDDRKWGMIKSDPSAGGLKFQTLETDENGSLDPALDDGLRLVLQRDGLVVIPTDSAESRSLKFKDSEGSSIIQHESGGGIQFSTDNDDLSPGSSVRLRIAPSSLDANSALYIASDGKTLTTTTPSATMYKENIQEFAPDISRLFELQLKSFTWKSTGEADCGFLAEDIESHIPELFRRGETVTGWKADRFPLYLFQALKDLTRRVTEIESAIHD